MDIDGVSRDVTSWALEEINATYAQINNDSGVLLGTSLMSKGAGNLMRFRTQLEISGKYKMESYSPN